MVKKYSRLTATTLPFLSPSVDPHRQQRLRRNPTDRSMHSFAADRVVRWSLRSSRRALFCCPESVAGGVSDTHSDCDLVGEDNRGTSGTALAKPAHT